MYIKKLLIPILVRTFSPLHYEVLFLNIVVVYYNYGLGININIGGHLQTCNAHARTEVAFKRSLYALYSPRYTLYHYNNLISTNVALTFYPCMFYTLILHL